MGKDIFSAQKFYFQEFNKNSFFDTGYYKLKDINDEFYDDLFLDEQIGEYLRRS